MLETNLYCPMFFRCQYLKMLKIYKPKFGVGYDNVEDLETFFFCQYVVMMDI
jgi:hypothetical protein